MKKLIASVCALVLTLAMAVPAAALDIDLSGLSWQELIDLRAAIMKEQLSRDEWQEVEVPQGLWKVGEDIPAGKWTIRCTMGRSTHIYVGDKLEKNNTAVDLTGSTAGVWKFVYRETEAGEMHEFSIDLIEGTYVQIDHCSATFSPFTGKPSLGFK